eukprot:8795003-Alexandrium_andersonii.AAC.1
MEVPLRTAGTHCHPQVWPAVLDHAVPQGTSLRRLPPLVNPSGRNNGRLDATVARSTPDLGHAYQLR